MATVLNKAFNINTKFLVNLSTKHEMLVFFNVQAKRCWIEGFKENYEPFNLCSIHWRHCPFSWEFPASPLSPPSSDPGAAKNSQDVGVLSRNKLLKKLNIAT